MFLMRLKPIHGWRVFFGEVAIIVLGVLIALVAQSVVEDWNWQSRVRHAEQQLVAEGQSNFFYAAERLVVAPCVGAQLDRLVALAIAPGDRLRPVAPIPSALGAMAARQPSRPYRSDAWDGIVGDGIAAHLDDDRRDLFSALYTQLDNLKDMSAQNDEGQARLGQFLVPLPLDPSVRARLVEQALSLKNANDLMALVGAQIMDTMWALGKAPPASDIDRFAMQSGTVKHCRDHALPLTDWRVKLSDERAASIATDDAVAKYVAKLRR